MTAKQGLELNRVVLLGRTFGEYQQFFDLPSLSGKRVLDVAGGVSSFTAEARARGCNVTAFDRIYQISAGEIQKRCEHDLAEVTESIGEKKVYRWDFYKSPEGMREFRARAYQTFLEDLRAKPSHYVAGELPRTPFPHEFFDLTLVSYLLFVYEDQLSYEFHKASILELLRITKGEIRIYPIVTFEAEPSKYLAQIRQEPVFVGCDFEIVPTNFEFLRGSNSYLRIARKKQPGRIT